MPRSKAWVFLVEVLATYSHSAQAAILQLCHTEALANLCMCSES
jgi:hypothetical protein